MKTLVFAPHPDDETLSCGGYILKSVSQGDLVKVVLVTGGVTGVKPNPEMSDEEYLFMRNKEFVSATEQLGVEELEIYGWGNDFYEGDKTSVIETMIDSIKEFKPDLVLSPQPNDIHRIHRDVSIALNEVLYHCEVGAYKAHSLGSLGKIPLYYYESPRSDFNPEGVMVCDISEFFNKKMEIFEQCYPDQAVPPFNKWPIARALHWGMYNNFNYGEAFKPSGIATLLIE